MRDHFIDAVTYAMSSKTMKIVPSPYFPKHATRTYVATYIQAHHLVVRLCWLLRRWIRIKPWIELRSADDADPIYFADHNTLYVGFRTYALMKGKTLCATQRHQF